jgi:UDP-N-acetylmuramoyl-tripeptide--D-alanyl-D-alanine ligase
VEINNLFIENKHLLGEHNFWNLGVSVLMAANMLGVSEKELVSEASSYVPTQNRSQWIERFDYKIFLDAYNANPSSMKVAVSSFISYLEARNIPLSDALFIIGSMGELGEQSYTFHQELGQFLLSLGISKVCFVGAQAQSYKDGFGPLCQVFSDTKQLAIFLQKSQSEKYSYYFIKGSRSLQLESLITII